MPVLGGNVLTLVQRRAQIWAGLSEEEREWAREWMGPAMLAAWFRGRPSPADCAAEAQEASTQSLKAP